MGCDIHVHAEVKKELKNNDVWVNADCWKYNEYCEIYDDEPMYLCKPIYSGRNYILFAMLAGVRNNSELTPISEPKGMPEDAHALSRKSYDAYGLDAHTPSWFTLKELKQAKRDNLTVKYSGKVSPEGAQAIDSGEMPDMWCQDTSISDYVYREWVHEHNYFDAIIDELELIKREEFWIFGDDERTELDDKVRIVFWFDN